MTGFQEVYEHLVEKYGAEEAKRIFADVAYEAGKKIAQRRHPEKKDGTTFHGQDGREIRKT